MNYEIEVKSISLPDRSIRRIKTLQDWIDYLYELGYTDVAKFWEDNILNLIAGYMHRRTKDILRMRIKRVNEILTICLEDFKLTPMKRYDILIEPKPFKEQ